MGCRVRKILSGLLLLGTLVLSVFLGLGLLTTPNAAAVIRQLEEAPGQRLYQSRQTLKDRHGNSWQAIAFKRIRPDGTTRFSLRLVGFPDVVGIDRAQPLMLTNSLGNTKSGLTTPKFLRRERGGGCTTVGGVGEAKRLATQVEKGVYKADLV